MSAKIPWFLSPIYLYSPLVLSAGGLPNSVGFAIASNHRYFPLVDGLRGLAACYVVGFHVYRASATDPSWSERIAFGWLQFFGHQAVDLFIVISGFCLTLPLLTGKPFNPQLFMIRRAKRILPPYYATVVLFAVAICVSSDGLHFARGGPFPVVWKEFFEFGNLITHVLLLHNWFDQWAMKSIPQLWSVATEFQIYVAFAFVLVPVWRCLGTALTVLVAWALGLAPLILLSTARLSATCPWYLGLFAFGMVAAQVANTLGKRSHDWLDRFPWLAISGLMSFGCAYMTVSKIVNERFIPLADGLWGVAIATALIALCKMSSAMHSCGRRLVIIESRFVVWLGTISYSLYLNHTTILMKLRPLISVLHLSKSTELAVILLVNVPLTVLASWCLWWLVERPSILWRDRKKVLSTESSASVIRAAVAEHPLLAERADIVPLSNSD